jgi:4-cresol dehydrogenase (hydroxylating)
LWTSIPDLGWGSVVGNSLENGIGYTPYGDHAMTLCGLEVVLADGSVLRTGMGGVPDNPAWHAYPHSFGPSLAGLFQQSNFGIVTRAGFWLMRRPDTYVAATIVFSGYERLAQVVDTVRDLMLERVIENYPMFSRGFEFDAEGKGHMNPAGDGWVGRFALYGRRELVDAQYDLVAQRLSAVDGVTVMRRIFAGEDLSGVANHDERVQAGIPDMDLLDPANMPYGEHTAHLDFSPVVPATGAAVARAEQLVRSIYERNGHPYVNGIILRPRSALQISTTFFDPRDEAQTRSVYDGYVELVTELAAIGHVPYRTNLRNMDRVAEQFSFGDHATRRVVNAIKDALDPNGVLAPGKSGIWGATTATTHEEQPR